MSKYKDTTFFSYRPPLSAFFSPFYQHLSVSSSYLVRLFLRNATGIPSGCSPSACGGDASSMGAWSQYKWSTLRPLVGRRHWRRTNAILMQTSFSAVFYLFQKKGGNTQHSAICSCACLIHCLYCCAARTLYDIVPRSGHSAKAFSPYVTTVIGRCTTVRPTHS